MQEAQKRYFHFVISLLIHLRFQIIQYTLSRLKTEEAGTVQRGNLTKETENTRLGDQRFVKDMQRNIVTIYTNGVTNHCSAEETDGALSRRKFLVCTIRLQHEDNESEAFVTNCVLFQIPKTRRQPWSKFLAERKA